MNEEGFELTHCVCVCVCVYLQEHEQFAKLRKHLEEEVEYHKDQIEEHQVLLR